MASHQFCQPTVRFLLVWISVHDNIHPILLDVTAIFGDSHRIHVMTRSSTQGFSIVVKSDLVALKRAIRYRRFLRFFIRLSF